MPRVARSVLIDEDAVGTYRCMNRCVRGELLLGFNPETGQNFEHRKGWIQSRLRFLAGIFAIDVLNFAVMDNEFHVILRNRPDLAENWTAEEVVRRFQKLFGPDRDRGQTQEGASLSLSLSLSPSPSRSQAPCVIPNDATLAEMRRRLSSISWFMGWLAQNVAVRANREDGSKGRFWQGRFKSVVLLDEPILKACMESIDLMAVRAGVAQTPQTSRFTSAYERCKAELGRAGTEVSAQANGCHAQTEVAVAAPATASPEELDPTTSGLRPSAQPGSCEWLSPFEISEASLAAPVPAARASNTGCLEMPFAEYMDELEWAAHELGHTGPCGSPDELPAVLARSQMTSEGWLRLIRDFDRLFHRAAGRPDAMLQYTARCGLRRTTGIANSRAAFAQPAA